MKVILNSSRLVKPNYQGNPPGNSNYVPLTVFDKVTFDMHQKLIFAYHPPTPPNEVFEHGLQRVLSIYRECAGRLGKDEKGHPIILLNDKGVRFVEASVDSTLSEIMPLELTTSSLHSFHPSVVGVEELVQVQLTRFTDGSMLLGYTHHHFLQDGHSSVMFLTAWASASRGIDKIIRPLVDRSIFTPRDPPHFMFDHTNVEFKSANLKKNCPVSTKINNDGDIIMHRVHFTSDFLAKLKDKACDGDKTPPYTTFETLVAHLWKAITQARSLPTNEITSVRIAVNGRSRLNPRVPDTYFGNLVLWAFPTAKVGDLLLQPLPYAAKLIHDAIAVVNDNYFRSFIDFANFRLKEENLVPTAEGDTLLFLCPNLEVSNLIKFPFYDLDFGRGCPFLFMPSYLACEGEIYLLPSFFKDGSIDGFIPLLQENLASFRRICNSLDYKEPVCTSNNFRSCM